MTLKLLSAITSSSADGATHNSLGRRPRCLFDYPILKGFYSGVLWLELDTSEGPITATVDQHSYAPIYVQVFTPKTPPENLPQSTGPMG
jgi:hypothetical protein